jgi:hypothetical protein
MLDFRDDGVEDFIGFYSSEGFWVDKRIDLFDEENSYRLTGIIPEISVRMDSERFSAMVCVDGLMLLRIRHLAANMPRISDPRRFEEAVRWWEEHVDYANALQFFIESESIKCPESGEAVLSALSLHETCRVGFVGEMPVRQNHSEGRSLVAARYAAANWIRAGRVGHPPMEAVSFGVANWTVLSERSVITALEKFEKAVANPCLVKQLSFIAKAKTAYARNDFPVAFTLLWFVIESAAKEILANSLGSKDARHKSANGVFLDLKAECLISEDQFERLDDLRKRVRNKLIHESGSATCLPSDCVAASQAALDLAVRDQSFGIVAKWSSGVEF